MGCGCWNNNYKEAGGIINEINLSNHSNIKIIASSSRINEKMLEKLKNF